MNKQVIHLFGASGSGTTTVGKYLSKQLGYFFMDTDDYFWENTNPPYTKKRAKEERIRMMRDDINNHDNVVISGSLTGWGDVFIPLFTLAVRVNTSSAVRLARIEKREYEHFGDRIKPGGDMYKTHCDFMEWASKYDDGDLEVRSKLEHDIWQKKLTCKLININGAIDIKDNFDYIINEIKR